MAKRFVQKINSDMTVSVGVTEFDEYEIAFMGEESKKLFREHKIPDQVIRMWDAVDDPDNAKAEKVFLKAVELLSNKRGLQEVYAFISNLIVSLREEIEG